MKRLKSLDELNEVKKLRLLLGWSQLHLASELGVSQTTIFKVEGDYMALSKDLRKNMDRLVKREFGSPRVIKRRKV